MTRKRAPDTAVPPQSTVSPSIELGPWERWLSSWAILALLVVPLAVLQQIDALLVFATPLDVLRDVALLTLLCGLPTALLALLGAVLQRMLNAGGMPGARSSLIADGLVLAPTLWVLLWQLSRIGWLWLKQATGHELVVSPGMRYAVMAGFVIALLLGWRLLSRAQLRRRLVEHARALRWPGLALITSAAALLAISPPQWVVAAPSPDAAKTEVPRPDVILITLDALSAIDADICSDAPSLMPQLQALARQSTCYTRLYASSNFTTPTTSSLETGTLPWTHLATQISAKVAPPFQRHTLAQALHDSGYRTYTSTDNQLASVRQRGTQSAYMQHAISPSDLLRDRFRAALTLWPQSSVPMLVDSALSFLGAFDMLWHAQTSPFDSDRMLARVHAFLNEPAQGSPAYVWVHSMPPHSPYLPPPSTKYRLLPRGELERWSDFMGDNVPYAPELQPRVDKHRLRYRESIMATDEAVGRLLAELQRAGRLDKALLIISADHGESFEKGFLGHAGPKLHEAVVRVPLIVKLPGQTLGRVETMPVSQADIAPSVLDYLGLKPLPHADGRSIAAGWRAGTVESRPVFSMSMERQSRFSPLQAGHYAVIDGPLKLLVDLQQGTERLYDLSVDPGENQDLAAQRTEDAARLRGLLQTRLERAEQQRRQTVDR